MTKHSTLIRNKGSVAYYHKGRGTQILGDKKRGTQKIFLFKGGTEDFHKKDFVGFSFACTEICSKPLHLEHLDYHEKFCCRFAAKDF